jgi:hypothetical protein
MILIGETLLEEDYSIPSRAPERRCRRLTGVRLLRGVLVALAATLVVVEVVRPLRRRQREPKRRRMQRNAVIGGLGAIAVQLCEQPIVLPLATSSDDAGGCSRSSTCQRP